MMVICLLLWMVICLLLWKEMSAPQVQLLLPGKWYPLVTNNWGNRQFKHCSVSEPCWQKRMDKTKKVKDVHYLHPISSHYIYLSFFWRTSLGLTVLNHLGRTRQCTMGTKVGWFMLNKYRCPRHFFYKKHVFKIFFEKHVAVRFYIFSCTLKLA